MASNRLTFVYALMCTTVIVYGSDTFKEEIFFKPLPSSHLYAYFQFIILIDNENSCKYTIQIQWTS